MQIQKSLGLRLVRSPKTACKVGRLKGKSISHYFTNCHWFHNSEMFPPDAEHNGTNVWREH